MNYAITRTDDYLMHHGIPGQKWGVRNGDHYPLNPSQHSAAEKKLAKSASKVAKLTTKVEKHQAKSAQLHAKADSKKYALLAINRSKAPKLENKANKQTWKANKKILKAQRIINKMEKIADKNGLEMPKETVALGEQYAKYLMSQSSMRYIAANAL